MHIILCICILLVFVKKEKTCQYPIKLIVLHYEDQHIQKSSCKTYKTNCQITPFYQAKDQPSDRNGFSEAKENLAANLNINIYILFLFNVDLILLYKILTITNKLEIT